MYSHVDCEIWITFYLCSHTHVLITTIRLYFHEFTFLKTSRVWGNYAGFAFSVLFISFSTMSSRTTQGVSRVSHCIWQLYCIQLNGHSGE